MFNMLDYLLVLVLLIGVFWGLMQGVGRLLIGLFSLYVGLVASLLLYRPLGAFFRELLPGMSVSGSQALAFVFLLLLIVNGLSLLTRFLGTPPEERKRKKKGEMQEAVERGGTRFVIGPLNALGGLLVGLVVTAVWTSLILAVLQFALRAGGPVRGVGASLAHQLSMSALVPVFNYVLFLVYRSVSVWLPGDQIPGIFAKILQL